MLRKIPFLLIGSLSIFLITGCKGQNIQESSQETIQRNSTEWVWGDLESSDLNFQEKKTQRQENWRIFRGLCEKAIRENRPLELPNGILELHPEQGEHILIPEDASMVLKGKGDENTHLRFYPLVIPHRRETVFKTEKRSRFEIHGIHFEGPGGPRMETYHGIKGASGVQVILKPTKIRKGFWSGLKEGSQVFVVWDRKEVGASFTLRKIEGSTITLSDALPEEALKSDSLLIGFEFPEEISLTDYQEYGRYWENGKQDWNLVQHRHGQKLLEDSTYFLLRESTVEGFITSIFRAGTNWTGHFINSSLQGHSVGISSFSGAFPNPSRILIDSLIVTGCGYRSTGVVNKPYVSSGFIWGSGGYLHNNVRVFANKLYCVDNLAGAWRQFSGSGQKPTVTDAFSRYENCSFKDNVEYNFLMSNSMPTDLIGCTFGHGNFQMGWGRVIDSCLFVDSQISLIHWTEPRGVIPYQLKIERSEFWDASIVLGWGRIGPTSDLLFENCQFLFRNMTNERTGFRSSLLIKPEATFRSVGFIDCRFLNRIPDPKGKRITLIRGSNIEKVEFKQCQVDEFDQFVPVMPVRNKKMPQMEFDSSQRIEEYQVQVK